jgi:ATP-dependent protease ClpP protease subunit
VSIGFQQNVSLEEPQVEEKLKSLRMDLENISKVVAENTGKTVKEVTDAMLSRTTLNASDAKSWGLVHEIKTELFPAGAEIISIQG